MKKTSLLILVISLSFLSVSKISFSQTLNLGILSSFEAYTGAGGISNAAGATFTGDAGTNIGIITGFGAPPSFTGNTYNANAVTTQCRVDLFRVYIHLNDLFVNFPATHAPAFGGGETLVPGVYSIPGAGSLGGAITLDGGGNPNAYFIIKFYGAMTVGAGATVTLTNGTQSCNVFWIAEGAISVAASANVKGSLFAKIGAVGLGAGAVLEGRMLTLEGAIVTGVGAAVSPPPGISTIPIFCETNCSPAAAVDVLGVLSNFALYTNLGAVSNTSTSGIDGNIGADAGGVSGYESSVIVGSFNTATALTAQANIDINNAYTALMALPNTKTHAAAFGVGETITAGVYPINGAGSLSGTIILDAENNPNAIFVFKFAGAFGVAAQSKIILANGARRCNVYWIGGAGVATGAVSIGAGAVLKGTFLSHGGACGSGAGVFLSGRLLSTGGAVTSYSGIIYNNPVCVTSTSLGAPVLLAVTDITAAVNGLTGGNTTALTSNDLINGTPVVIGTAAGNVSLTGVTVPAGLTLNANGTVTVAPNTAAGNYSLTYKICEFSNSANCSSVTSTIVVSAAVIVAVVDNTPAVNGQTGGTTPSLTLNDLLNGNPVVIGTASGNVILTGVTVPLGFVLNPNGTVTIAPNTPAGSYNLTYKICEVSNPTNCSSVTSAIVVSAAVIVAVADTPAAINGTSGVTNIVNVLANDLLNGTPVTIAQVNLSTVTPNANLILNADGSVDVAPNTPAGTYTLTYKICEKLNPTNCNSATLTVPVFNKFPDFIPTIDINDLIFSSTAPTKDFVVNIGEIGGVPSAGQVVVKITKLSAFTITYGAATTTANGGVTVNNSNWTITETDFIITMTLKAGVTIGSNSKSAIGFTLTLKPNVPTQTTQPITASIVNGSGSDSNNTNNTYSTVVKAQ